MNTVSKAICVITYLLGIAAGMGMLPEAYAVMATIAIVLLVAHALEVIFMFRYVKLYDGGLPKSIALTLLFGLLHWLPLKKASERAAQASNS